MKKILIIEDDRNLLKELREFLERNGYQVESVDNFLIASQIALEMRPDLVILDINLPGISGFDICKEIKEKSNIPVLMLTSRVGIEDEIKGLEIGADEYLAKPVDTRRLILRMEKLLDLFDHFQDIISVGDLSLELSTCKLSYKEAYLILPQTEADIIKKLMESYPQIVTKDELLMAVWSTIYIDENILQVNITRLRKKLKNLGPYNIYNKRGQGYGLGEIDD
ncbi:response regulator transcription factor [Anaerococcus degeneri]|uniref:Response regulator transcription factor n=1 Tax=Anaerococcus degeneri TaxID=361500 RepID=A0ABS7YZ61_9FIRM|nr:response regulator transcription factor [Anaerococcus degeneri]MBP2014802.1 DNA-binding response OmpR family regulator [Anaerococcus degeneri]MCA2097011.1 response regulator transcription factor [Anaerococcus degeneri]